MLLLLLLLWLLLLLLLLSAAIVVVAAAGAVTAAAAVGVLVVVALLAAAATTAVAKLQYNVLKSVKILDWVVFLGSEICRLFYALREHFKCGRAWLCVGVCVVYECVYCLFVWFLASFEFLS